MSEHTPGPWDVTEDGNVVESDACLESGLVPAMTATVEGAEPIDDGVIADAHLIAASPDLLAVAHVARELVRIAFDCHQDQVQIDGEWVSLGDVRALVYAAIAKAEGRE